MGLSPSETGACSLAEFSALTIGWNRAHAPPEASTLSADEASDLSELLDRETR